MSETFVVAIDGPSGAGKSTIAKALAGKLNIEYIDTGAMYRACAVYILEREGTDPDYDNIVKHLKDVDIELNASKIILNGEDVSDKIRTNEVSKMASKISAIKEVREALVEMQRKMATNRNVVMDGRDIGTNVFPDARYKFFLTASLYERAQRRHKELIERGENIDQGRVMEDIYERDYNDSTREHNPLMQAKDAVLIDSTGLNIDEVVEEILKAME